MRYRMYGLVPYNLSPIQQGIQFGHAVVEYGLRNQDESNDFLDWAKNDKTFIILNGGTTNDKQGSLGTLNTHLQTLRSMGIKVATFNEPDLGDQLTAVIFLVDERVWDEVKYPTPPPFTEGDIDGQTEDFYNWVDSIGGDNIWNLRVFLKQFKLA